LEEKEKEKENNQSTKRSRGGGERKGRRKLNEELRASPS